MQLKYVHNVGMNSDQYPQTSTTDSPESRSAQVKISLPTVEPILVYAILLALAPIYFYYSTLNAVDQNIFLNDWAKINQKVYEGEYYRLFTSMFLHLNTMHILFNGYALYLFGRDVESLFGHVRFGIIYFMGGLAGSIASLLYTDAPSIGASGAVFAVFGAMGVYLYRHRHFYGDMASARLRQMAILAGANIVLGFIPDIRVDNAAHIGGLIGGIVLAWFICPEFELLRDPLQIESVQIVDTNTPEKWVMAPLLFGVGIVVSVAYAASVLG
jgi:rhomboid protease GluP